jgi:NADH-quinone oxidoreductase subunit J
METATMGESITFIIFAAVAIAGAASMLSARNPIYSAVGLLSTMFAIAIMYILLDAQLVAVVQVIIYAGAVMTLFLFVIMLIGVDNPDAYGRHPMSQRIMTWVVATGFFATLVLAGRQVWITGSSSFGTANLDGTIENVADELFGTWTIVFLATVILLTIAALGTIALAYFSHISDEEEVAP